MGDNPVAQDIDNLRDEIAAEVKKTEEGTKLPEKPKHAGGRPSKRENDEAIAAMVRGLLSMPFGLASAYTKSERFQIPKDTMDAMVIMGVQVWKDFGMEGFNRWINLFMLTGMYGGVFYMSFQAWRADELKAIAERKQSARRDGDKPAADINNIREKGVGKNVPDAPAPKVG